MNDKARKVETFTAEDPNGERYTVIVYETPQQTTAAGVRRPILQRRFITSDGQELRQRSSRVFRIVLDGLDLTAMP